MSDALLPPPPPPPSRQQQQRLFLVVVACVQTMLCAGIIFGWASVAGTLLVAPFEDGGANLTMDETISIFAVAASIFAVSSLFLGYALDTQGPRICSLLAHLFILVGCNTVASAISYRGFLIGTSLMAFGGPGIQLAVFHLANLFPDQQFTVMSCISGSVTISFVVFPIFDLLWERYGIGFRIMFRSYLIVIAFSALATQLLWPDEPYETTTRRDEPDEKQRSDNGGSPESAFVGAASHTHFVEAPLGSYLRSNSRHQMSRHQSFHQSVRGMLTGNYSTLSIKDQPFWCQLFSGVFTRILLVFCCTSFMANFYVAALPTELADLNTFPPNIQHSMARSFTLISSIGILASFLIGWLMDRIGLESCTILTLVMGQLHMIIIIFCSGMQIPMIVGFFVYTLFRNFLYAVFIACLSGRLGFKYFGMINGLGFAASGMTQLYITPLVRAVEGTCHMESSTEGCSHGYWKELHIAQFCLLLALTAVPLLDTYFAPQSNPSIAAPVVVLLLPQDDYGSTHQQPEGDDEYDKGILI